MHLTRFYTKAGHDFIAEAAFRTVTHEGWLAYTVPQQWNQAAVDVLRDRIFYPEALPAMTRRVPEPNVPEWLWRSEADNAGLDSISAEWRYRNEKDIRDVLHRMAGALAYRAWKDKLLTTEEDAKTFYDEFRYILLHQLAAPELKQWQSLGLDWAYGLGDALPYVPTHRIVSFKPETTQALKRIRILGETLALETPEAKTGVTLPVENSDSPAFIAWKKNSDVRQAAEDLGRWVLETAAYHVMDACDRDSFFGFDPARNHGLRQAVEAARQAGLDEAAIDMAISYAEQGYEEISFSAPEEDGTAESCIKTILSVPDDFIEAALTGHSFPFDNGIHYPAEKLWDTLAETVWSSGEPAISFRNSINTSNALGQSMACDATGGFVFLPDSAAPSATINLVASATKNIVDLDSLRHITRIIMTALEAIPTTTQDYRPVLLGITNISALLMGKGIAYDSDAGRATTALVAGLISGTACQVSAEMAAVRGAFSAYPAIAKTYLQTIKDKMAALAGVAFLQKGMTRRPVQIRTTLCPDTALVDAVREAWENAYHLGKETGFRHAHLTGMDTDPATQALLGAQTQDIMPEAALVRFEGYFSDTPEMLPLYGKKLNPMVPRALAQLGYNAAECDDIYFYAVGHGTLLDAPHINHQSLRAKGFHQAALDAVEAALTSALHIRYVFNKWTLGEDFCHHVLGFSAEELGSGTFDMLSALGFSEEDIEAANIYCCGTMTLEGAPHLNPAHFCIFDCVAPCGSGVRRVSPEAQIKMQAAIEPFLSGAVAHTVMLDHHITIESVQKLILTGWELGVKNLKLYRDNCSLLHPMILSPGKRRLEKNTEEDQLITPQIHKVNV